MDAKPNQEAVAAPLVLGQDQYLRVRIVAASSTNAPTLTMDPPWAVLPAVPIESPCPLCGHLGPPGARRLQD